MSSIILFNSLMALTSSDDGNFWFFSSARFLRILYVSSLVLSVIIYEDILVFKSSLSVNSLNSSSLKSNFPISVCYFSFSILLINNVKLNGFLRSELSFTILQSNKLKTSSSITIFIFIGGNLFTRVFESNL